MNKTYRSLWNCALGAWVAVAEITRARGKRSAGGDAAAPAAAHMGPDAAVGSHFGSVPVWLLASLSVVAASMFGSAAWAQKIISGTLVLDPSHKNHRWVFDEDLHIASVSTGTLNITQNSQVSNARGVIGYKSSSSGNVMVAGAGSTWTNKKELFVGTSGRAALTMADRGLVGNTIGAIGYYPSSRGDVTVTGKGSIWTISKKLFIGSSGEGALTVMNRGLVSNTEAIIGNSPKSIGLATVTDSGSQWRNNGNLIVGRQGNGTLRVLAGGWLSNIAGVIGDYATSTGQVTVIGAGSIWGNSGTLTVGQHGNGTLTVSADAKVSVNKGAGVLHVASHQGSTGVVNIGGAAGSPAQAAGSLAAKKLRFGAGDGSLNFNHTNTDYVFGSKIAGAGRGRLNHLAGTTTLTKSGNYDKTVITGGALIFINGAKIENNMGILGDVANSSGQVIVSGVGAVWNNDESLIVGESGAGTLTVKDGAAVNNVKGRIGDKSGASGRVTVSGAGSTWTNYDLAVGGSGTGALLVSAGGKVENVFSTIGDSADNTYLSGEATVSGEGASLINRRKLVVGKAGRGLLTVSKGGKVSSTEAVIGSESGSIGEVMASGKDASLTSLEGLYIGDVGKGKLTVSDGAVVSNAEAVLGNQENSVGNAMVTGAGSSWTSSQELLVGNYGTGRLKVKNGGEVDAIKTVIGSEVGSFGEVMLSAKGSSWTSKELHIGNEGEGTLTVSNGATVSNAVGVLGVQEGAISNATVTGVGSSWSSSKELFVGDGGNGILTVKNRGKVHCAEAALGFQSSSTGMATVSGEGSTWINSKELVVGAAGKGTLAVSQGAAVSNSRASIGHKTGSTGAVVVIGRNSSWTNNGRLDVGHSGNGTLTVKNAGVVTNLRTGSIGFKPDSTGYVTVSGADSSWASQETLVVGDKGKGTLTVADGANVSVNNGLGTLQVAAKKGSIGVMNIGGAADSAAQAAGTVAAKKLGFGAGAGSVNFNHLNTDYVFNARIVGPGQLNQIAGTTILTGANDYTGASDIAQGTLQAGAAHRFSAASAHSVGAGATLNLAGFDQTLASLHNSGTVRLSAATAQSSAGAVFTGTTLKITGPYVGKGGSLALSTQLDGSSSASDRLLLSGPKAVASGSTTLQITNVGGLGAQTTGQGIEIIGTENGARLESGAFTLIGEHVDAGAFEYRLAQTAKGAYLYSSIEVPPAITTLSVNSAATPPVATSPVVTLPVATPLVAASPTVISPAMAPSAEIAPAATPATAVSSSVSTAAAAPPVEAAAAATPPVAPSLVEPAAEAASAEIAPLVAPQPVTPAYRAEVPLLSALPAQLRQADMAMLGDMYQRVGDESSSIDSDAGYGRRAWGRILRTDPRIGQQGTVSAQSSGHLTGFQAGLDLYADSSVKAGLYVGELKGNMRVNGLASGVESKSVGYNQLQSRYLGFYGSWQGDAGLYADAVLQAADYRSSLQTDNKTAHTKGHGWLASLEVGKPFAINSHWQVEPQAQLIYRQISLDDTALSGATVQHKTPSDWTLRLGARIKGSLTTAAGVLEPYGRINVYKASATGDVASFSTPAATTEVQAKGGYTSTALAAGATLQLNQRTSVYGELGQHWANGGDTRVKSGLQASLGVKVCW